MLNDAIFKNYYYEMYVEDIPFWAYLGETFSNPGTKAALFAHLHFKLGYNHQNQIVAAKVTTDVSKKKNKTNKKF